MKKIHRLSLAAAISPLMILGLAQTAKAQQEQARVLSSTPVITQVAVPRQVCAQQAVQTGMQGVPSGAGAVVGAVIGGAIGSNISHGSGRAVATVVGTVAGAAVGNQVEVHSGVMTTQRVQNCSTQTVYENRATAYNVVYEYAGKQYQVQMPQDPGAFVTINMSPVGVGVGVSAGTSIGVAPVQTVIAPSTVVQPAVVNQGVVYTSYYPPATAYYPPVYPTVRVVSPPVYSAPVVIRTAQPQRGHGHGHGHRYH